MGVTADKLHKEMYIGVVGAGDVLLKNYSLLRTNGVAEKVYTDKSPQKPYTWLANVIAIAIDKIGDVSVGAKAREVYLKTGSIEIPKIVLDLSIADATTMLVEIHRTVWKSEIRNQDVVCKYCGHNMRIDIDLDRIKFLDEDLPKLEKEWQEIEVYLPEGYVFEGLKVAGKEEVSYADYKGLNFNRFTFRVPTLGDAIRNEKYYNDNIVFWRRIAFDCLTNMAACEMDASGNAVKWLADMPETVKGILGMKLFDEYLLFEDLDKIRQSLREDPPTMPFFYEEECSNPGCRLQTPVTVEASGFFST